MSRGEQDFGIRRLGDGEWLCRGPERWLAVDKLGLPGAHNAANALASLALGTAVGLDRDAMLSTLKRFTGLPHRCELVAASAGIHWYNDSKATNLGATRAAIQGMEKFGPLVLIAGGEGKDADFSVLRKVLSKVRAVILIGRDARLIEAAIAGICPTHHASSMRGAVELARELAQSGDIVLLSPACASFDMYESYQARGDDFRDIVQGMR